MEQSSRTRPAHGILVPLPPLPRAARVVGPGRLERSFRGRIAALERELETAHLVERGAHSRLDKLEGRLCELRDELARARQLERRLVLTVGELRAERAALRARLQTRDRPSGALVPAASSALSRTGWLRRLFSPSAPSRRA